MPEIELSSAFETDEKLKWFKLPGELWRGKRLCVLTRNKSFKKRFRVRKDTLQNYLQNGPEPYGQAADFPDFHKMTMFITKEKLDEREIISIIAHEALHLVRYHEAYLGTKFDMETEAFLLQDVILCVLSIMKNLDGQSSRLNIRK